MGRPRRVVTLALGATFGFQMLGAVNFFPPARVWAEPSPSGPAEPAQVLAQTITEVESLLAAIKAKTADGLDATGDLQRLQALAQTLQTALQALDSQLGAAVQTLQPLADQGVIYADVIAQVASMRANFQNASVGALGALATTGAVPTVLGQVKAAQAAVSALSPDSLLTVAQGRLEPPTVPHRRGDAPRRPLDPRATITPGLLPPRAG